MKLEHLPACKSVKTRASPQSLGELEQHGCLTTEVAPHETQRPQSFVQCEETLDASPAQHCTVGGWAYSCGRAISASGSFASCSIKCGVSGWKMCPGTMTSSGQSLRRLS